MTAHFLLDKSHSKSRYFSSIFVNHRHLQSPAKMYNYSRQI